MKESHKRENEKTVSVVVPVYKKNYLNRCIESLTALLMEAGTS